VVSFKGVFINSDRLSLGRLSIKSIHMSHLPLIILSWAGKWTRVKKDILNDQDPIVHMVHRGIWRMVSRCLMQGEISRPLFEVQCRAWPILKLLNSRSER